MSDLIEQFLRSRGLDDPIARDRFFNPEYESFSHDPYLLPDMTAAVDRLVKAQQNDELVFIYGDYDIDGLTATTLLLDAFAKFGLRCKAFIPNRFVDGYGLSEGAMREIAKKGAQLVVTVDCGSLSHVEVDLANKLGLDVIITDHHSVADKMPDAVATINPKRTDHSYPFIDLAGVGVAFKLVQAMQSKLSGLPKGQEKWLLDLVALGTVCDVVQLIDENRMSVFWGLKVLAKTRRPGIKALMQVTGVDQTKLNGRSLGFVLGPHLNASGRLETAQYSLDLLTENDPIKALDIAYKLREMNVQRRADQDKILKMALEQAETFKNDPVLVLSHPEWSHGIIGIVAAKILETYKKPTFVLQEQGETSKGSARSYGDFSAVEAIRACDKWLIKGGGHKLAAGITLKTSNIDNFRNAINEFYKSLNLNDQHKHLDVKEDVLVNDLSHINDDLMGVIKRFEPFGHGNPEPVLRIGKGVIHRRDDLGQDKSHLKIVVGDGNNNKMSFIGFSMARKYEHQAGEEASVWFKLIENEWRGLVSLEGRILKIDYPE